MNPNAFTTRVERPSPTAAPSSTAFFSGLERLPSPEAPVSLACAMFRGALPSTSATSVICEHSLGSPETPIAASIRHLAVTLSSSAFALSDDRRLRAGWRVAPCGDAPVELPRNRTRSARAAQVPPIHVAPKEYARRALSRSAWLGHLVVAISWIGRLKRPTYPGFYALPELAVDFSVHRGHAFAMPAAPRPAFAGRGQRALRSRSPAKRTAIRGAQGVFHP